MFYVKRAENTPLDFPLPSRGSPEAAGLDLRSALGSELILGPGQRALVRTGWHFELPPGFWGEIKPRSGLAKKGLDVLAGVIDSDYRGEVHVMLINHGFEPIAIQPQQRMAQVVIQRHWSDDVLEVPELDETMRGDGGFGSTGTQ